MSLQELVLLVGGVTGLLGGAAAILNAVVNRQKGAGDFTKAITEAASNMVTKQDAQISKLEGRVLLLEQHVDKLETENKTLKDKLQVYVSGVLLLVAQLRALGHKPVWEPPTGAID